MFGASMSNSTTLSDEASVSSGSRIRAFSIFSCNNNNSHSINTADNNATSINNSLQFPTTQQQPKKIRKKRSLPGNPDPDAEVIALSPKTLMATNRFVCEICNKGFQRDQNLQLHRRGHNLPWKLKQRSNKEVVRKRAYVCPEPTCVHHHPSRALGDLTGIKKHFCRKHGEKKWKCDKCSKIYAVQSDWKAHSKTCGTREYRCDCGTIFSRKDSFVTHRAFCDALAEESARLSAHQQLAIAAADRHHDPSSITLLHHHQPLLHINNQPHHYHHLHHSQAYPSPPAPLVPLHSLLSPTPPPWPPTTHIPLSSNDNWDLAQQNPNNNSHPPVIHIKPENLHFQSSSPPPFHFQEPSNSDKGMMAMSVTAPAFQTLHSTTSRSGLNATSAVSSAQLSATALLQKAATVGAAAASTHHHQSAARSAGHLGVVANTSTEFAGLAATTESFGMWRMGDGLTRDFLGLTGDDEDDVGSGNNSQIRSAGVDVRDLLGFTKNVELHQQVYDSNGGQSRYMKSSHHHGLFGFAENHHINSTAAASGTTWSDC